MKIYFISLFYFGVTGQEHQVLNSEALLCVSLVNHRAGEACWWIIHPASKQRSEGEKVRVGDDLILVSVSSERYLVSVESEIAYLGIG